VDRTKRTPQALNRCDHFAILSISSGMKMLEGDRLQEIKHFRGLISPFLVPYLYAKGAEMNGLERPANAKNKGKKKQRTLADYGLGMMGGDTRKQ